MTKSGAKTIFWAGTLVSAAIFAWLTVDFHRQEPKLTHSENITDAVVQGKEVWQKYNCNDCHTILGFGGYYAPDMTKAYYRLGENNIVSIVMNPEKVYKDSFRKMPHLGVTRAEAEQLVAFLHWTADIDNNHWPPQDEKYVVAAHLREKEPQNLDIVTVTMGACGGCHSFGNLGRDVAGDFNDIAKQIPYDKETLTRFILDPPSVNPDVGMPAQNLSPETAGLIADFILSLKK